MKEHAEAAAEREREPMELIKKLFHEKGYIDGITIINLEGEILFTAKLNGKLSNEENAGQMVGKKFLDVYENLDPENSTMLKAMELGVPLYVENQLLKSKGQEEIRITSLSIPIKSRNRIVGVIDLSMEENREELDDKDWIDLNAVAFPIDSSHKLVSRSMASFTMEDIIAVDEKMRQAKEYIKIVAACDLPVMIYGETGTGKEVFAQSIHNASARKDKPFIAQNCAALPDTLLESILFGTSKGAFTGATENKGLFELADGGTLFLDEINSMPLNLQSKLLRVLQDGSFRSLGSKETKKVNVKIIAALNTEPVKAIQEGQIRRDIYYRLSMMSITIPPLRERKKDIPHFIKFYVNKHNETFHKKVQYVSKELIARLEEYDWPGNVRELEHMIVYGMSVVNENSNTLNFEDIEVRFRELGRTAGKAEVRQEEGDAVCKSLKSAVEEYEQGIIRRTLRKTGGNISEAAKLLDVPRQTLQRKVKQYRIL